MTLTVRELETADRAPLLAALAAAAPAPVLGASGAALPAYGAWLAANPAGLRTLVGCAGGEVVAHLSAVARITRIGAESRRFVEMVGGWVAPHRRRGLRRAHDYQTLATALFEAHLGVAGDFLYHGCPAPIERRLCHGLLEWKPVTTIPWLHYELGTSSAVSPVGVQRVASFDVRFAELFARCLGDFEAATLRDATFLQHRFADHPAGGFEVLAATDPNGGLRGYAVLRRSAEPAAHGTILLWDWLVPAGDEEVGTRLLAAAVAHAKELGGVALAGCLPEWSPWFTRFQDLGFRVRPSNRFLFARVSSRKFDSHWLHQGWWHTLADTVLEPQLAVPGGGR